MLGEELAHWFREASYRWRSRRWIVVGVMAALAITLGLLLG